MEVAVHLTALVTRSSYWCSQSAGFSNFKSHSLTGFPIPSFDRQNALRNVVRFRFTKSMSQCTVLSPGAIWYYFSLYPIYRKCAALLSSRSSLVRTAKEKKIIKMIFLFCYVSRFLKKCKTETFLNFSH